MVSQEIHANIRTTGPRSTLQKIRATGRIPAIVYGLKKDPLAIDVSHIELLKIAAKENPNEVYTLVVNGNQEKVLVREFSWHPVKTNVISHIDFIRVADEHPVTIKVPVTTHGMPVGVKTEGGQFSVMKKFVKVSCKAADIPAVFSNDISELRSGTIFYARDINFPQGKFLTPPKTALFGVSKGRKKEAEPDPKAKPDAKAKK